METMYWSVAVLNRRAGVLWLSLTEPHFLCVRGAPRAALVFATEEIAEGYLKRMLARYPNTVAGIVPAPAEAVVRFHAGVRPWEVEEYGSGDAEV